MYCKSKNIQVCRVKWLWEGFLCLVLLLQQPSTPPRCLSYLSPWNSLKASSLYNLIKRMTHVDDDNLISIKATEAKQIIFTNVFPSHFLTPHGFYMLPHISYGFGCNLFNSCNMPYIAEAMQECMQHMKCTHCSIVEHTHVPRPPCWKIDMCGVLGNCVCGQELGRHYSAFVL